MKHLVFIAIIMFAAVSGIAQETSESSKWEVYGGYSLKRGEHPTGTSGASLNNPGFEVAVTRNLNGYLGLKIDYGRNSRSTRIFAPIFGGINVDYRYSSNLYVGGLQL